MKVAQSIRSGGNQGYIVAFLALDAADETTAERRKVERITGIEIILVDWVILQDERFDNGDREVRVRTNFAASVT